jgi:hypothetical protein
VPEKDIEETIEYYTPPEGLDLDHYLAKRLPEASAGRGPTRARNRPGRPADRPDVYGFAPRSP